MEPVPPALDGASIAGLVPALVGERDYDWIPAVAREADAVVLLVLDGLGWSAVRDHADDMPVVTAMHGGPITSVVPSTTATALTSICTGLAPAQHGVVGYRMLVDGSVLNCLRWTVPDGKRPPNPEDVQRHPSFLGRDITAITRAEFRNSGFSRAHLRGARFKGWHTTAMLVEECARAVNAGDRFVYAYYPGVDNIAHEYGLFDHVYRRELAFADRLVGELLDALPARAALLVTSDHGQIHLEPGAWIELGDVAPLVQTQAGDARFRSLYAKPGRQKELAAAARDAFGHQAWVRTRAELLDEGWLGTGATGSIPGRIGDVVLAAFEPVGFVDPMLPHETSLRSGHGSLTPDEMHVPLLAGSGRA